MNHVLQPIEGHYIRGYGDRSRDARIYLLPQAVEGAARFLGCDSEAGERIGRFSKLIEGFETPYGMELLATVHWVCQEDPEAASDREVAVSRVQEWSARKRIRLQDRHIRKAWLRVVGPGVASRRAGGRLRGAPRSLKLPAFPNLRRTIPKLSRPSLHPTDQPPHDVS